ncbi:MAG: D-alanyl-D-alanine carboxypeptidase, partial [Desulfobulbaceae bacterium]|nr:D-alanyl-D-alanine carboxypeptidase [Desulfobulbaceae bacterium]
MVLNSFWKRLPALLCLLLLIGSPAFAAGSRTDNIDRLLENGSLILMRDGKTILSRNPDQALIPASIWKLATALSAIHTLGSDYRFTTNLYLDNNHNLYVQGKGDPYLVSEEVDMIMTSLAKAGVSQINDIILDKDSFQLNGNADGASNSSNPYDAANGALAVNFNTVNILINKDLTICSAEPQTPTLPIMTELGASLGSGKHRINIGSNRSRIILHAGELFRAIQIRHEINGMGEIREGKVPKGMAVIHQHRSSKNLSQLIEAMLLYSNNFIANQLFLTCGAKRFGYPATWEKGQKAMREYLANELNLAPPKIKVEEGSGLSRKNRITTHAMQTILENFKPYSRLLPFSKGKRIKSGTLTGVYSYAGYLPG